jgi:mycoredoxin
MKLGACAYTFRATAIPQMTESLTTRYDGEMQLLVYTASWCRDCREAKRFLDLHRIPYTEVDIESTPGAATDLVKHVGKRAIPQFVIDVEWVQPYKPGRGFLYEEMSKRLGVVEPQS